MRQKSSLEIFFNLGGDGTLGNSSPTFTLPVWQYSSQPLDITVGRDVIIITGSAPA